MSYTDPCRGDCGANHWPDCDPSCSSRRRNKEEIINGKLYSYEKLEERVGADGQYFNMNIGVPHRAGDMFTNGNITIQCVEPNKFVIKSDRRNRFLKQRDLVKNKFLPLI